MAETARKGNDVKPTVARVVHYVSAGSADGTYPCTCRAAVITEVQENDGTGFWHVSLAILNPEGMHFRQNVQQSEPIHQPMTWHWPEREESDLLQQVAKGMRSTDDIRRELGQKPWGLPETS